VRVDNLYLKVINLNFLILYLMDTDMLTVVMIGTGNVATHLTGALLNAGVQVLMIYSRTASHARVAGQKWAVPATSEWTDLPGNANVYVYAVSDNALPELLARELAPQAIHIHTAGSVGLDVFGDYKPKHGVLYPLQTFSKSKSLNFKDVPLFVEASSPEIHQVLKSLALLLSEKVYRVNSEQRCQLHLAAVFACNFVNHFYAIADELIRESNLPFDVLKPLIAETASKIDVLTPKEAQTGPAVRGDTSVMDKHIRLLENYPELKDMYEIMSKSIAEPGLS
jgi:predicted short-subunit dehydrogenase-like oxidoreductase (DUF2520 family)